MTVYLARPVRTRRRRSVHFCSCQRVLIRNVGGYLVLTTQLDWLPSLASIGTNTPALSLVCPIMKKHKSTKYLRIPFKPAKYCRKDEAYLPPKSPFGDLHSVISQHTLLSATSLRCLCRKSHFVCSISFSSFGDRRKVYSTTSMGKNRTEKRSAGSRTMRCAL